MSGDAWLGRLGRLGRLGKMGRAGFLSSGWMSSQRRREEGVEMRRSRAPISGSDQINN
jgi:hypothetical protein